ncbi:MAG: hypothetical protein Ct9H90mP16_19860 [Candidatus Poseidoniales archaeon]|nr:MAG: hypothetical protein Ct9H90mP16_19860 [Candidatus Poseidoniales archaeon]
MVWIVALVAMLVNAAREIVKESKDEAGDVDRETLPKVVGAERARALAQLLIIASFFFQSLPPYAREMLPMEYLLLQCPAMLVLISVKPNPL